MRTWISLSVAAAAIILGAWIWSPHRSPILPGVTAARPSEKSLRTPVLAWPPKATQEPLPGSRPPTLREQFRAAKDYAAFVQSIAERAAGGDAVAEFLTAKALGYCDRTLQGYFGTARGHPRSLSDVQMRWANRQAGYEREIAEVYERCHAYLEDPDLLASVSSWESWLDKAVAAGYPPAQADKASILQSAEMIKDGGNTPSGETLPMPLGPARTLALTAAVSGDPDALMGMSGWVDGSTRSNADYLELRDAWMLLACQRGNDDCGADSEMLKRICIWDPQCAPGDTLVNFLQRELAGSFPNVENLAQSIGTAVDRQDPSAMEPYL